MRLTKLIIYNLSILIILLFIIEVSFKIIKPTYKYYERTYTAKFNEKAIHKLDTNWVERDNDLGWVCRQKQDLKFYRSAFFDVNYQINKQGFRNTVDFDSLTSHNKKRILLIGDSFLFGIFLQNNETISAKLQQKLGDDYEIINLAIPGWGIDQMYQAYTKYIDKIAPEQVILFYIDDDISRTVEAFYWGAGSKTAYALDNGKLKKRDSLDGKLNTIERFFVFNSQIINRLYKINQLKKAAPLSEVILQKMITAEQKANRKLQAFRFPRREQIGHNKFRSYDLASFFTKNKVAYFDIEKELRALPKERYERFYINGDDHPSAVGTDFITIFLSQKIK